MPSDAMREIQPGIWHWTARNENIRADVSSYYVEPAALVIDPMEPEGGLEAAFDGLAAPQQVVLTSGHHNRHAQRFADAFGIPIRGSREAQERLGDRLALVPCSDGEEIVPGLVTYLQVGVLCPDEGALLIAHGDGALALADSINGYGPDLAFMPDFLLGDDPEDVKAGLSHRLGALLQRDFDTLLLAHGAPRVGGAKAQLRDFVAK